MKSARSSNWHTWLDVYERVYCDLQELPKVACPNCQSTSLKLVFTSWKGGDIGYASFWCEECLFGISLSRVNIPAGAQIRVSDGTSIVGELVIPNYEVVAPEIMGDEL